MPFLSMKCTDSATFWTINKLAHYLKMFQFKFAVSGTITVKVSKLQCQKLQFFKKITDKKGYFLKLRKTRYFFNDFV